MAHPSGYRVRVPPPAPFKTLPQNNALAIGYQFRPLRPVRDLHPV